MDLADSGERDVERERGLNVAEQFKIDSNMFFEISALEGTGFDEMFEAIVREIRKSEGSTKSSPTASMPPSKNGSGCCR